MGVGSLKPENARRIQELYRQYHHPNDSADDDPIRRGYQTVELYRSMQDHITQQDVKGGAAVVVVSHSRNRGMGRSCGCRSDSFSPFPGQVGNDCTACTTTPVPISSRFWYDTEHTSATDCFLSTEGPMAVTRIPIPAWAKTQKADDRLDLSLSEIDLLVRTVNCLEEKGIFTVRDLLNCTPEQLLEIPNLGEITLETIYEALAKIGFHRTAADFALMGE